MATDNADQTEQALDAQVSAILDAPTQTLTEEQKFEVLKEAYKMNGNSMVRRGSGGAPTGMP